MANSSVSAFHSIVLLLLLASLLLVESFTFTEAGQPTRWLRATPLFQQHHDDVINAQSNRSLQFDVMNLLKTNENPKVQSKKLQALSSILQSCNSVLEENESTNNKQVELVNLSEDLSSIRCFINTSSNSKDHQGCFKVFTGGDTNVSLPPNVLLSMNQPFTFLRDSLSYKSDGSERKKGGMMFDGSEAVVWCSLPSDQDFIFCSSVMDDMPFSQLYLGVDHDDDYVEVELDVELVTKLDSMRLLHNERELDNDDNTRCKCKIKTDDLNVIQTIVSEEALEVEQQTIIKMIDAAVDMVRRDPLNESKEPHLVLLAHCLSCSIIAKAIATWKEQQLQNQHQSPQRIEDLLHQALTVVTFGNVCQSFSDGPAYIHISMYDDPWTNALGSHSGNEHDGGGGGKHAVYFHAWSPYDQEDTNETTTQQKTMSTTTCSLKSHNAHSLNSCLIQYLCLIMRINGIQSFRALYDSARFVDPTAILDINPKHFAVNYSNHGELVIPPRIDDELLPAMIFATGGDELLWGIGDESRADLDEVLPDEFEARSHLEESFGYSVFEEIQETCNRRRVVKN